ncbi:hypothetical protein H5410_021769 [Solanum commersonii]|uniref:Uncharacterized protein n=1 Tax=Solanum commersonii TaxID=4109 RepID=A0A9J5ZF76_SOLCO|nr:hypothetical protein H5410_021769 [Solanum commersonii]
MFFGESGIECFVVHLKQICDYIAVISCKVVSWTCPIMGFKCDIDGGLDALTCNFSSAFCIRDVEGNFVYAETRNIGKESMFVEKMKALMFGLVYCCTHIVLFVLSVIDSLIYKRYSGDKIQCFDRDTKQMKRIVTIQNTGMPNMRIKKYQNNMETYYKNQKNKDNNNECPIT